MLHVHSFQAALLAVSTLYTCENDSSITAIRAPQQVSTSSLSISRDVNRDLNVESI